MIDSLLHILNLPNTDCDRFGRFSSLDVVQTLHCGLALVKDNDNVGVFVLKSK